MATTTPSLEDILQGLPDIREKLRGVREVILANAVMAGESPAPTYGEERRVRFLTDRFTEESLQDIQVDEAGNAIGVIPGKKGENNILLAAHADTVFASSVDHTVTVTEDALTGAGIADNALGVATLASLSTVLERLGIELDDNLILVGSVKSLGRGDLEGIRFFCENATVPFRAGICIEGVHLGRLSYASLGMLRGVIQVSTPEERSWDHYGDNTAIIHLNRILSQMLAIPTPRVPRTSVILGSIDAGTAYNTPAINAALRFELRSEENGVVSLLHDRVKAIIEQITLESPAQGGLEVVARRHPGGLDFSHPLVAGVREIMGKLGVNARIGPSTGELSALIAKGIPAVTIGLTEGARVHNFDETVRIEPLFTGLAQLLGLLQAIDGGFCDEEN